MDSLKDENFTTAANSTTNGTTNSTTTTTGPSVTKPSDNCGNVLDATTDVKDNGAGGDGPRRLRNPKPPLTICSGRRKFTFDNEIMGDMLPNSPNKYWRNFALPTKNPITPIHNYGLKSGEGFATLNKSNSINTAGATGGGDAPYLGVNETNPYADAEIVDDNKIKANPYSTGVNSGTATETKNAAQYSRKVFVGGLPPDINEEEIINVFRPFGPLVVDWPHKITSKSEYPPKGYAFVIFYEENSVQLLVEACITSEDKLYLCVSSPGIKDKPVQIRPWRLSDASYMINPNMALDPRKTIFVGGVPRPLKAYELAMILNELYGGVCYAGIDTDPELKYPKGAARVVFYNQSSYIAAISARFVQLQHGDIDKRVEMKPYILGNQLCDECKGQRCGGKFAAYFCTNLTCLQYYCAYCWAAIHAWPGRQYHKPLVKEGGVRPRVSFRW